MAIPPSTEFDARARKHLGLTALTVSGLLLWLFDLCAVYAISTHECDAPRYSWGLTIAATAITAGALAYTASLRKRAWDRQQSFQLQIALMMNALALLLLLGFAAPLAVLRPCE
jgi:uncharacterized membrane protein YidH (DUF202 family)